MPLCKRCGLWNGPCGIHHGEKPSPVIIYRRRCGLSRWKCTARQASVVRLVMAAGVTPVAEVSTMDSAGCRRSVRTFASLRKTSSAAQTGLYDVKHVPSVVRCTSTPAVNGIHATQRQQRQRLPATPEFSDSLPSGTRRCRCPPRQPPRDTYVPRNSRPSRTLTLPRVIIRSDR